ncbi:MAG: VanW family protein, partial [bacterium]
AFGAYAWENYLFRDRFFSGVKIGSISIGKLTKDQARALLTTRLSDIETRGLVFELRDKIVTLRPIFSTSGVEEKYQVLVDIDQTLREAWKYGRSGSILQQLQERQIGFMKGRDFFVPVSLKTDELKTELMVKAVNPDDLFSNAKPEIILDYAGKIKTLSITPEKSGTYPRVDEALATVEKNLSLLANTSIKLKEDFVAPSITAKEAAPQLQEIANYLSSDIVTAIYQKKSWQLTRREIAPALIFTKDQNGVHLGLDKAKLEPIFERVKKSVEYDPVNAKFEMAEDKVITFQPDQPGLGIDKDRFVEDLNNALAANQKSFEIATRVVEPDITLANSNDLGIQEKLGTGTSSYGKSPVNRVVNIKNGADKLNLILIEPDEEFSLLAALRPFDESGGYVPELVIKGSKLEPEVGGGLCQIGTTVFRAVMNSGLPVTERRNHSLVVSYYADPETGLPGTDATIYDPAPDFKFKNDTGHYLLFVAEVLSDTNSLRFSFWGTSDGRQGSYSTPVVTRWMEIPKDAGIQYLESKSVASGKQVCKAGFRGAIASFVYTIEKPDIDKVEETFASYYRMIPPVCLVAPGELPKPKEEEAPVAETPITALEQAAVTDAVTQ